MSEMLPPYATTGQKIWFWTFRGICALIFVFLITPILVVMPLSFNVEPYFSFTSGMLALESDAYSSRWYADILRNGTSWPANELLPWDGFLAWVWESVYTSAIRTIQWIIPFWDEDTTLKPNSEFWTDMWANAQWIRAIKNSFFIGICATLLSTSLGTLAAIGLSRDEMPFRRPIMAVLISPMIVPLVIIGAGMFYFFSNDFNVFNWFIEGEQPPSERFPLAYTYAGIILGHAVLGTPFVIITVTATLVGFDNSLVRASNSLGANPVTTFFKVQMPLILPGVISGALFAFITSFDEVVIMLQMATAEQRTIPRQMFSGIREQISPTILAVATILVIISVLLLTTVELLRRRSEKLRGMSPG